MKKINLISKRNMLRAVWIIYALASIIVWLPRIDAMFSKDLSTISQHVSLNDSWDIMINDEHYSDVSLDDFHFDAVNNGDEITMQRILPDNWNITEGALRLHIRQTTVSMYIDDEAVYEYGYGRMAQHKTIGSGFQFINFPNEYQGKTLKIRLCPGEDKAFSSFDPIHGCR